MMADDTYAGGAEESQSPAERAGSLEHEIEDIRSNLDRLLGDLDRRRHEAFNVRLQWQRHKVAIVVVAASVISALGGIIALVARRRRMHARLSSRFRRFSRALAIIGEKPERVTSGEKTVTGRILSAAGGAAAAMIARQVAGRLWQRQEPVR